MTTSGTTDWELTARDIVKLALEEGAILDPGTDPDDDEFTACYTRLNGMLKSWQMRGVSLSHQATDTVTTVAATASKALDSDVRSISSARLRISATNERPLWPIDRTQYLSLPNKAAAGKPTMYYFSRQRDSVALYLWPVSASIETILIDCDRIVETVTNGSETLDIRQELMETVWSSLAVRIAAIFDVTPKPELVTRAAVLEQMMFDAERPDSYLFEYDDCA